MEKEEVLAGLKKTLLVAYVVQTALKIKEAIKEVKKGHLSMLGRG